MPPTDHRLATEDWANLVAYLDNELPEDQARALAAKLTQSVAARREVETLQRTWELLGHLERPEATPDLLSRTLTAARTLEVAGDARYDQAAAWGRRATQWVLAVVLVAASAGIGWAATARLWPDRTARLARELDLAQSWRDDQAVGSVDRLRELERLPALRRRPLP